MNQAQLYSKYSSLQKNDAAYVLENYCRLIKLKPEGGESVLDIGCGAGDVTVQYLLPHLPSGFRKLTGADLSEAMVHYAKGRNSNPKIDFVAMDIAAKEMEVDLDEEFDHIFSFNCLHWIQDQRQTVKNIYQLLKPGGDILISFIASNPIFTVYENMALDNKWIKYMRNVKDYISPYHHVKNPEKQLEKHLQETGFSVHLCKVVERHFVYNNINVLKKSVTAINPFIEKLPETMHGEYLMDFVHQVRNLDLILKNENNNEEKIKVPYKMLVVVASKGRHI